MGGGRGWVEATVLALLVGCSSGEASRSNGDTGGAGGTSGIAAGASGDSGSAGSVAGTSGASGSSNGTAGAAGADAGAGGTTSGSGGTSAGASGASGANGNAGSSGMAGAAGSAGATPVCFFSDSNYQGASFCVGEGAADVPPEWNDVVSSVQVAPGYKAELWADIGMGGRVLTLIADEPYLPGCFFNDSMSSYRVGVDAPSKFQSVNFLRKISGCKIVAGQHNDEKGSSPHEYTDLVTSITGKTPALWSGDFGFSGDPNFRWDVTHEAEKQWAQGAIVNMMFHACPPTVGSSCDFNNDIKSHLDDNQWTDLITDGGTLNSAWKSRLDEIVPYLQDMQAHGVEVMFRPLHEMNQGVFWWGGRTGALGTARLFQITHDYLVLDKGLTHVGFVWDVQNLSADYDQYNPGAAYWDISAIDFYGGSNADSVYSDGSFYDALLPLSNEMPMAVGETFFFPTPAVQQKYPQMSFFMIWAYGLHQDENGNPTNSDADIQAAYGDARVITLTDMPGWQLGFAARGSGQYVIGR